MQPLPAVPQSTQGRTGFSSLARLVIRGVGEAVCREGRFAAAGVGGVHSGLRLWLLPQRGMPQHVSVIRVGDIAVKI